MNRHHRRSFTLLELLVVMGVIVILTSLSIPAINKFLKGQSLLQSGRIVQSAFNEARRAAITQRNDNYLLIFRTPDNDRPGEFLWGLRRYREGYGYEGEAHMLLPGVKFDTGAAAFGNLAGNMAYTPFDGGLPAADASPFNGTFNANLGIGTWLIFQADGTLRLAGGGMTNAAPPTHVGASIMDMGNAEVDGADEATVLGWTTDLMLVKTFGNEVKKCFLDVTSSGMVRARMVSAVGE